MVARGIVRLVSRLLLGVVILLGGCNVFEGLGTEADSVETLLVDARLALNAGNTSRAVALLERAFEKDSTDVRVRVELGNALYSDRNLDLLTLRNVAEHFVGDSDSSKAARTFTRGNTARRACTDGAKPDASDRRYSIIPFDAGPIPRLVSRRSVIERVHALVVEGVIHRRTGVLANASVRVRRKAFLIGAATTLMQEAVGVHDAFVDSQSDLFLDRQSSPPGVLIACAKNQPRLERNHEAICALSDGAEQTIQWLGERAELSGTDRKTALVERLDAIVEASQTRAGCSKEASMPSASARDVSGHFLGAVVEGR